MRQSGLQRRARVSHPFQRHIATSSEQPVLGAKGRRGRVGDAPHMMCRSNYANAGCGGLGVVKVSAGMFRFCCDIKSILYRLDKTNTHSFRFGLSPPIRARRTARRFLAHSHLASKASSVAATTARRVLRPGTAALAAGYRPSLAERWINASLSGLKQLDRMDSERCCQLLERRKLQGRAPSVRRFNPRDEIAVNSG